MKLTINKFKSISNKTIEIPAHITGRNGVGKTTILEAVSFVLTGKNIDGSEFKQLYDFNDDLHIAKADVVYTDNYGNTFHRIVSPVFKTNRQGVEEISVLRNTTCYKNGLAVNDYASEFADFAKFGTDWFFRQKEDEQRKVFIDALKNKMPVYDIVTAQLQLKEAKKAQKTAISDIDVCNKVIKEISDVGVSEMPKDLLDGETEYQAKKAQDNSAEIERISKLNNVLLSDYQYAQQSKADRIRSTQNSIASIDVQLKRYNDTLQSATFTPKKYNDVSGLMAERQAILKNLETLVYFDNLNEYAESLKTFNPVVAQNIEKIKEYTAKEFVYVPDNKHAGCPLNGQACEIAAKHDEEAKRKEFENQIKAEIAELKHENKQILNSEMYERNSLFLSEKLKLERVEKQLSDLLSENEKIGLENEKNEAKFQQEIQDTKFRIGELEMTMDALRKQLTAIESEVINEPVYHKALENVEISPELQQKHNDFVLLDKAITGQIAINENNQKIRTEKQKEIEEIRANLFILSEKITKLQAEITDYFSNLSGVVKNEFPGNYEIDVKLLKYVIKNDDYSDCFIITANGKSFPYECNGAMINNVKLQILNGLQRLTGYTGVTVFDNCEANTTEPINILSLKAITATATMENDLTI